MSFVPFGLSTLMEAIDKSDRKNKESEALLEAFEDTIDEDIIDALSGDNYDDDVESDMDGEGLGDEAALQKLIDKIPPSDEMDEDELDSITESFFDEIEGEVTF